MEFQFLSLAQISELNLVVQKDKVVKFNIVFFDKYIELNKEQNIKVGTIKMDSENEPFEYKKSDLIDFDQHQLSQEDKLNLDKILLNINSLDKEHYQQVSLLIKAL